MLQDAFKASKNAEMWIEKDLLPVLAGGDAKKAFAMQTTKWWSQMKTAGSAIYANRHYLDLYNDGGKTGGSEKTHCEIKGHVFIHKTAQVDPTAVLGPNVSLGPGVKVGAGARIRESIILTQSNIGEHAFVAHSVIGIGVKVGAWTRVEGTPNDPNPNKPFAKMDNVPLFNVEGKLNPSITILGCNVEVPSEIVVLNAIVLPHKQIDHSFKNEIVL